MKRGKILFGAICAVFAAMAFIGCQPTTGGGSSALAPFAGTTWTTNSGDTSADTVIVFNTDGTWSAGTYTPAMDHTTYTYTVESDGEVRKAICCSVYSEDGVTTPPSKVLKVVIESADAETASMYTTNPLTDDGFDTDNSTTFYKVTNRS